MAQSVEFGSNDVSWYAPDGLVIEYVGVWIWLGCGWGIVFIRVVHF